MVGYGGGRGNWMGNKKGKEIGGEERHIKQKSQAPFESSILWSDFPEKRQTILRNRAETMGTEIKRRAEKKKICGVGPSQIEWF